MTLSERIASLIADVLDAVCNQFYTGGRWGIREFKRDERALTKAVARYGYECARRGWEFSPEEISRDLLELLNQIKRQGVEDVHWFPRYLEGAVDRHVGRRSEELRELSLKNQGAQIVAGRVIDKLPAPRAAIAPEPKAVELLALLYRDQRRATRQRRAEARQIGMNL